MLPDLRTTGSESAIRKPSSNWVLRSRRHAALFSAAAGAAIFCVAFFAERYFHYQGANAVPLIAGSNALAALLAALLILRLLFNAIERRREVLERMRVIAEINHHVRNGLELIQLSAHTSEDQRAVTIIREGVERIEWVLRETLGPTGPLGEPYPPHEPSDSKSHVA